MRDNFDFIHFYRNLHHTKLYTINFFFQAASSILLLLNRILFPLCPHPHIHLSSLTLR